MKKLIELDAAVSALDGLPMDYGRWDVDDVLHALASVPTVDAVPVVRCRDCEYRERYGADIIYCERHSMMTAPDCFCSDGNNEGDGNETD